MNHHFCKLKAMDRLIAYLGIVHIIFYVLNYKIVTNLKSRNEELCFI